MDRRTLLQTLVGVGGVGALGTDARSLGSVTEYPTIAHPNFVDGLRLHWSGWKGAQEHRWLVGQWFAWGWGSGPWGDDSVYYYLNVPGMVGNRYDPGDCFNITPQGRYVYPETPGPEKDRLIWEGYAHLLKLLGEYA